MFRKANLHNKCPGASLQFTPPTQWNNILAHFGEKNVIEKAVNFGAAEALNQEQNQSSWSAQSSNWVLLKEDVKNVRISPCSELFEVQLVYTIKKIKYIFFKLFAAFYLFIYSFF